MKIHPTTTNTLRACCGMSPIQADPPKKKARRTFYFYPDWVVVGPESFLAITVEGAMSKTPVRWTRAKAVKIRAVNKAEAVRKAREILSERQINNPGRAGE